MWILNFFKELYNYDIHIHNIININFNIIKKSDTVIIGGGGLLDNCEAFNRDINRILDLSDNVIFWSLGFHKRPKEHHFYNKIEENIRLDNVKLLSIRDYNHESKIRYVPCATCMIPYFDSNYRLIKRDIGVINHYSFQNSFDYETITNSSSIETIVNFILTSNIILTNSYHAAYWATLMKKKVIIYGKFANKFDYFKYKPVEYSGNISNDIDKCYIYEDALSESRELTINYFKEIKVFLNNAEKKYYNIGYEEIDIMKDNIYFISNRNISISDMNTSINNDLNKLKNFIKKMIDKIVWFISIRKYRDKLRERMLDIIK